MFKAGTLMLMLAVLAAPALLAAPEDFDAIVNGGQIVVPTGQLPDGEVNLSYNDARVTFEGAAETIPGYDFVHYRAHNEATDWPAGLPGLTVENIEPVPVVNGYKWAITGTPGVAGSYIIGVSARYNSDIPGNPPYDNVQYYQLEIQPQGTGVTYPDPPSAKSSSGGGGDDESCTTAPASGYAFGGSLIVVLGALVYRRRRRTE